MSYRNLTKNRYFAGKLTSEKKKVYQLHLLVFETFSSNPEESTVDLGKGCDRQVHLSHHAGCVIKVDVVGFGGKWGPSRMSFFSSLLGPEV
jgi:hypothetical protein